MSFPRASAGAIRALRTVAPRAQVLRQSTRRGYSSGQQHTQSGSDLPWALGGLAVTVPACFYILKKSPEESHHPHLPTSPHGTEQWPQNEIKDPKVLKEKEDDSPAEEDQEESSSEEKYSNSDAPPSERDIKDGDKNFHGKKGEEADAALKDYAYPVKPAGDLSTMSGKQEGLSNTDTRHPRYVGPGSGISHKGEGSPESSKSKGTIDPEKSAAGMKAEEEEKDQKREQGENDSKEKKDEQRDDKEEKKEESS